MAVCGLQDRRIWNDSFRRLRLIAKPQAARYHGGTSLLQALSMAGGRGTRFWPRSRFKHPKQFLTLSGDRSLLQQAFDRIEAQIPPERAWIITGAAYTDETAAQLRALPPDRIIGEPCGRDTAACIGLGAA